MMDEEKKDKVHDYIIMLNTQQSGQADITTEIINGELKAIIFQSIKPVQIIILLPDTELTLYENNNLQGTHYMPLKVAPVNSEGERFNYASDSFVLNDTIRVIVKGGKESEVKIIMRVC